MEEIVLRPIGVVASPVTDVGYTDWGDVVSEIHLSGELTPGLLGLSEYSHITVIFYLNQAGFDITKDLTRHPRDRVDVPKRGVFATRTQYRPNPVGVSSVPLLGIEANVLKVQGLDALDGTPVLDIKPYLPDMNPPGPVTVPEWTARSRG